MPVFSRPAYDRLRQLFEIQMRGAGAWNYRWPDDEVGLLAKAVAMIKMAPSDAADLPGEAISLALDSARLAEADEAWVPVATPDGLGILLWPNSD